METPPAPPRPDATRWLAAANVAWLLAGLMAYYTAATLVVGTAVALVVALPGLLALRHAGTGTPLDRQAGAGTRLDQALAAAVGTWTLMAVLVLIPYIASEQGLSLWSSTGFQAVGLAAASLGFLLWNLAASSALGRPLRRSGPATAFHLLALAAALYLLPGDGTAQEIVLRGEPYALVDLQASPLAAALPGLVWAAMLPRGPPAHAAAAGPAGSDASVDSRDPGPSTSGGSAAGTAPHEQDAAARDGAREEE